MAGLPSVSLPPSPVSSNPVWASAFSRNSFAFTLAGEHGLVWWPSAFIEHCPRPREHDGNGAQPVWQDQNRAACGRAR